MAGAYGWAEWSVFDPAGRIHLFRYYACMGFVEPDDIVIEAACGNGAGADLMSRRCKQVIAYELEADQIAGARGSYKAENIEWIVADLEMAILKPADVAVTIETIEHLADATHFVKELHEKVRKFIVFTVDTLPSVASGLPTTHKKDYSIQEAIDLMTDDDWLLMSGFMMGNSYWGCVFNQKYFRRKYWGWIV